MTLMPIEHVRGQKELHLSCLFWSLFGYKTIFNCAEACHLHAHDIAWFHEGFRCDANIGGRAGDDQVARFERHHCRR